MNVLTGRGCYNNYDGGSAVFADYAAWIDGCTICSNVCNTALTRYRTVAGFHGYLIVSNCFFTAMVRDWMTGSIDLDGRPRCIDKRGKVTADALPDIGCYECEIAKPGVALLVR